MLIVLVLICRSFYLLHFSSNLLYYLLHNHYKMKLTVSTTDFSHMRIMQNCICIIDSVYICGYMRQFKIPHFRANSKTLFKDFIFDDFLIFSAVPIQGMQTAAHELNSPTFRGMIIWGGDIKGFPSPFRICPCRPLPFIFCFII